MPVGSPLRAVIGWGAAFAVLAACPVPAAAGVDGSSVPSAGGGFSGPTDPGARGVIYNPAALGAGEAPELLIDVGMFREELRTTLVDLEDHERTVYLLPQPSLAVSVPLGRLAVGGFVQGPYSRGADDDADSLRRFLSIGSDLQLIEGAALAAFTLGDRLTVAGGLRIGQLVFRSDRAIDSGLFLNDAFELTGDTALPEGDPFLEGQQRVGRLTGVSASWMAGASLRLVGPVWLHAAFRPRWEVGVAGPVVLQPSNDLNTVVAGRAAVRLPFPLRASLAASIPVGRLVLRPQVELVAWGEAADVPVVISDLRITSSDPVFDGVLRSAGLAEADFLQAAEGEQVTRLGWHTVVNPGLQADLGLSEAVALRGGVFWGRSAVPDPVVTPANVDFETFGVRAAVGWRAGAALRLSGTVEGWPSPARTIAGTVPADTSVPSGDGRYQLVLWRAGLTAQLFLSSRGEP